MAPPTHDRPHPMKHAGQDSSGGSTTPAAAPANSKPANQRVALHAFDPAARQAKADAEAKHVSDREAALDAELEAFIREEKAQLGIPDDPDHWIDPGCLPFTRADRAHTTILIGGLSWSHDLFLESTLKGLGYNVKAMTPPDNEALRYGKEFGNRGQCSPTYFTVGNLVKFLCKLRDSTGMSEDEISDRYVFLTADACGPCRFGSYKTEYRKALRDSGFTRFRVVTFQQKGGDDDQVVAAGDAQTELLNKAAKAQGLPSASLEVVTGDNTAGPGLDINGHFFGRLAVAVIIGDVLNGLMYRIRPYEVVPGATNIALEKVRADVAATLSQRQTTKRYFARIPALLLRIRKEMGAVEVDRLVPKPKVAIIGEFWAMTTEGDGNYKMPAFLEAEGAEVEVQFVTAWGLYNVWEVKWDTLRRMKLSGEDGGRWGLQGSDGDGHKTVWKMWAVDKALRGVFQSFAWTMGMHGFHLSDMDELAEVAGKEYQLENRGGEGHMEVAKLLLNTIKGKTTMTLSVKPFGCMPSSGVSDGVQSIITARYPDALYLPVETTGDGAVNVYSRVQMVLFKARQRAKAELESALADTGMTMDQARAKASKSWRVRAAHWFPKHVKGASSTAAQVVRMLG